VEGVPNIFVSLSYFSQTVDDSLADLEKLLAVAQSRHETFVLLIRQENRTCVSLMPIDLSVMPTRIWLKSCKAKRERTKQPLPLAGGLGA
jgi:hypothetical protein